MSILVDAEIERMLEEVEDFTISGMKDQEDQIQPASVDLRLGQQFIGITNGLDSSSLEDTLQDMLGCRSNVEDVAIDPREKPEEDVYTEKVVESGSYLLVPPGTFVLGTTCETVSLPANIIGRVEGKSSLGRLGIAVHSTAGFIDPGFKGQITLEIYNHAPRPVKLHVEDYVCQLVLSKSETPARRPYGCESRNNKYQHQTGTSTSCSFQDYEVENGE